MQTGASELDACSMDVQVWHACPECNVFVCVCEDGCSWGRMSLAVESPGRSMVQPRFV